MDPSDVLDLLELVSVHTECPVVPESSDYSLFPGKRSSVPLGKAETKINGINLGQYTGILPQGDASPFHSKGSGSANSLKSEN